MAWNLHRFTLSPVLAVARDYRLSDFSPEESHSFYLLFFACVGLFFFCAGIDFLVETEVNETRHRGKRFLNAHAGRHSLRFCISSWAAERPSVAGARRIT